jgi:phospholipase C
MATRKKSSKAKSHKKKPPKPPKPSASPIEHIVVLMQENRSFDHVFGYRHGVNGLKGNEFNLVP